MSGRGQSSGGRGGGRGRGQGGGPSTTVTKLGKTAAILARQRQNRASLFNLNTMRNIITTEIPNYKALEHHVKLRKRTFCNYDYQVFQLARDFIYRHTNLFRNITVAKTAYECLGVLVLVCALDRANDMWTTAQELNQNHQAILLKLATLATKIFVELFKSFGSPRYQRLMTLGTMMHYFSSMDLKNAKNFNRNQLLINHIRQYIVDLKPGITEFFNKIGRATMRTVKCTDYHRLIKLLNDIETQRKSYGRGASRDFSHYQLSAW